MIENEHRIFGIPGSGKTTHLTQLVQETIKTVEPRDIVAASFTKAAAEVLAGRDLPIPDENIGTLHSLCYRALGHPEICQTKQWLTEWNEEYPEYTLSVGMSLDTPEDASPEVFAVSTTQADTLLTRYQIKRAQCVAPVMWDSAMAGFAEKWVEWKVAHNILDFTDLIELAYLDCEAAPGNPAVGFFDEVQDFTELELALVRHWGKSMGQYYLAGDDEQCIYSFTGARPDAFLNPQLPPTQKTILGQSYRVPQAVMAVAQKWAGRLRVREPKDYRARDAAGEVRHARVSFARAGELLPLIEQDLSNGKTVMLIASCSYMLEGLKAVLRESGIPFHNPYRLKRVDWNPLSCLHGTPSARRLAIFLGGPNWTLPQLKIWVEVMDVKKLLRPGVTKAAILNEKPTAGPVKMGEYARWFSPDALPHILDPDLAWFEESLLPSKANAFRYPLAVVKRDKGAINAKPGVIIGTIHSVKGGEADSVYLFPDMSTPGYTTWLEGGDLRDSVVRMFYVGMTRAREKLTLCDAARRTAVLF